MTNTYYAIQHIRPLRENPKWADLADSEPYTEEDAVRVCAQYNKEIGSDHWKFRVVKRTDEVI